MDPIIHTLIAIGCIAGAFYAGKHIGGSDYSDNLVTILLDKLERDGYILTETDKDGEKELIPVSEVIAEALREASKISSKNVKEGY